MEVTQARRNSREESWYEVESMTAEEVARQNREYGWRKYRIINRKES